MHENVAKKGIKLEPNKNMYLRTPMDIYVCVTHIYIYIWWFLICSYKEVVIIEAQVQDEL